MYYNPPPQTSPAINHKLQNHHDAWGRPTHQHHVLAGAAGPPTPGYSMYTNGAGIPHHPHPHMPQHPPLTHQHSQHHHTNSLPHPNFSSPPNGTAMQTTHPLTTSPPASAQIMSQHWQQQLLKYDMVRASRSPHHRARQSAIASRPTAKSAITITDPNRKPSSESKEGDSGSETGETTPENHPSSTRAPVATAPRPSATKAALENSWAALDMGGISLKNLPSTSRLFSFEFLQNLYLNHNQLQEIPPAIAQLKHLELLDLSGNMLQTVPPEIGMITSLKELYLFDNHIMTLPFELGTLHQLQTLGIEGNPIAPELKEIVQRDGSSALIAYLRNAAPVPDPPPQRPWISLQSDIEREAAEADPYNETFTLLCYNILCERAATERLYGYTPKRALEWNTRKDTIMDEVKQYSCDFLCLQEVDIAHYEDFFLPRLSDLGYDAVYWPKLRANTMDDSQRRLVDGCAIFFKTAKYSLVEKQLIDFRRVAMQRADFKKTDDMFNRVLQRDNIAVVGLFENKVTGTRLIVANVHVHWDPHQADVKLVQVALLIEEVEKIAARFARYPPPPPIQNADGDPPARPPPTYTDSSKIPLIVAGDFNSVPDSGVYEFLSAGSIPFDHPDFLSRVYGRYTSEGLRHRLGLRSAYAPGDISLTNYVPSFRGVLDYIWFSAANMQVTSLLGDIDKDYLSKVVGFPNFHFPSDHVRIVGEFRIKPPKETLAHATPMFSQRSSSSQNVSSSPNISRD